MRYILHPMRCWDLVSFMKKSPDYQKEENEMSDTKYHVTFTGV